MTQRAIVKCCKEMGCCDLCCLRYLGLKNPSDYEKAKQFIRKLCEEPTRPETTQQPENKSDADPVEELSHEATDVGNTDSALDTGDAPPTKKMKTNSVCVSCIGVLQEGNWPHCYDMVKDMLDKKGYECATFACALSAPAAALLRERCVALRLSDALTHYDAAALTPLKEAWKWSFGAELATHTGKGLDSGAVSPLMITLNMEYPDEAQELEALKSLAPALFESRRAHARRFAVEFTRRAVKQALDEAPRAALLQHARALAAPAAPARPVSVAAAHAPLYLGGRYVKLSRALPQTPWLVNGRRMMHSSVQEIICEPIATLYRMSAEETEHRLKFISAGREDVDVRCLGDGRPFAIEITDPARQPSEEELRQLCERISDTKHVIVRRLVPISREHLALLKKGEETKCKTYEALCIKLSHSVDEQLTANGDTPIVVTPRDIENINGYSNTSGEARVLLQQRTPIRVLHRRPLLTRTRRILQLSAAAVPGHAQLFVVRVRTEAGTYIKEWAHGELGRTRPRLADALGARADILALDVTSVELDWPHAS